ncbi:MAG: carboxypeptidase-like regulatory domain-containing protein, partial [Polaromonas sp.]|uniref:carboxypeptidase-like regulatory domain-containing protein n=1 Tax=Polaromonas sp. TaxID=1869339 RepID=UPI00273723C2
MRSSEINYQHSRVINAEEKKVRLSSAYAGTRALVLGLAFTLLSSAAMAASEPIPNVVVVVKKHPDGSALTTVTNKDGIYKFTGLAPGKYDLIIVGRRNQSITVDEKRTIAGMLMRNDDGTVTYSSTTDIPVTVTPPGTAT